MSVVDLFEVPDSAEAFHRWSFSHMTHHRNIVNFLNQQHNVDLPIYILDPVNPQDFGGAYLLEHQQMHNNTEGFTNISGFDLTTLDPRNPEELAGWILLNAQLHYNEATALGIWS